MDNAEKSRGIAFFNRVGPRFARIPAGAGTEVDRDSRPAWIVPEKAPPKTDPWLERLLGPGGCKGKILLVDDDREVRDILQEVLKHRQYFVRVAGDGVECLKLAKTMRPDLILLNYRLAEDVRGIALCVGER